jgi:microtubule-associated protein-like 6
VYHTAGCCIALNKTKNTMRVNTAHNDDIICLDVNPNKNIAVTGEMGRRPSLIVWDALTL